VRFRAVLFDLDGTLWGDAPGWRGDGADFARLTEIEARRLAPVFEAAGVRLDPLEFTIEFWDFARRREQEQAAQLIAPNGPGLAAERLALKGVAAEGVDLGAVWAALDVPASMTGRMLFDDAVSTLEALAAKGFSMAVVSNRISGGRSLHSDFELLGVREHFKALVCSSDIGRRKPHPLVFEHALRELGVAPGEAVMVGDSFENDVRGARAAGMTAVLKLNGRQPTADERHEADYLVHNLSDLLELGLF
jgi:FMN phosphatase YigB (HAD superfamily)